MTPEVPPPVLDYARVLAYAMVPPDALYVERRTLYRGSELIGRVPCLAICQNFGEDEVLMFHCDSDWKVLGVVGAARSVDEAKATIQMSYPNLAGKWLDLNVSEAQARAYLRTTFPDDECSFCERQLHEVKQLFVGENGRICDLCVREYASNLIKQE
jgi:hypothetical protein